MEMAVYKYCKEEFFSLIIDSIRINNHNWFRYVLSFYSSQM